jgi:hypothetical protein
MILYDTDSIDHIFGQTFKRHFLMEIDETKFFKGFNAGYFLAKFEPKVLIGRVGSDSPDQFVYFGYELWTARNFNLRLINPI